MYLNKEDKLNYESDIDGCVFKIKTILDQEAQYY